MHISNNNNFPVLNGAMKEIIIGAIKSELDDIIQTLIDDPLKAIDALNAVKSEAVSNTDIAYFESKGIWDSILNIRNILAHNCPQNRNRGDHNAFWYDYLKGGEAKTPAEKIGRETGVFGGLVYFFTNGFGSKVLTEPQGLLSLTARSNSISKPEVVAFIHELIDATIKQFQSIPEELKTFISQNVVQVRNFLSRSDITLEQLNQIGIDGLRKLLPHPLPVYRLTQKVYIPLLKLIHFDEETRQALIQYSSDIAKLVEEDHVSWTELLDLSPSAVNAIKKRFKPSEKSFQALLDTLQTIKRENHRLIADNPVTSLRRLEINKLNPSEKDAPQEINNNQVDSNTSLDYMELQALLELQSHGLTAKDLQAFKRLIFTQNHKLALTYLICHDRLKPMAAIDILNTASPNEIQELAEKHLQTQIENNQQPNDSNSNNNNLGGLSSAVNSMDMDFVPELNTNSTSPGSDQPISLLDLETALESLLNLPGHPAIEEPDEDISTVESDTVSLSDLVIEGTISFEVTSANLDQQAPNHEVVLDEEIIHSNNLLDPPSVDPIIEEPDDNISTAESDTISLSDLVIEGTISFEVTSVNPGQPAPNHEMTLDEETITNEDAFVFPALDLANTSEEFQDHVRNNQEHFNKLNWSAKQTLLALFPNGMRIDHFLINSIDAELQDSNIEIDPFYENERYGVVHKDMVIDFVNDSPTLRGFFGIPCKMSISDALSKVRGLNNEQIIALKTLYRYGLRSGDLRQLSSSIFNSEHTEMLNDLILSQGLTAKEAMAEIVNTSMVFPFIFKIPENVLLKYLTNQHNLSEQDALNEINGLNSAERSILMALYKNGLRKTHLKKVPFFIWKIPYYNQKLTTLIVEQNLTPDQAVQQIYEEAEPSFTYFTTNFVVLWNDIGVNMLAYLFPYGIFSNNHIQQIINNSSTIKNNKYAYVVLYLVMQLGVSIDEALTEVIDLDVNKLKILWHFYADGLRREHLMKFDPDFTDSHFMLLQFFLRQQCFSVDKAVKEVTGFPSFIADILLKLYDYGVRRHHFEKFPNYKQTIYDPESFQKTHQDTLFDLVIEHELNINNALNEIVNLDGNKVALLRLLYAHGLRRQHLDKFITPFSSDHFEALVYLIDTNNLNPETAVAEINGIEDHAALKCIAKLYSRNFTRRHIVALNSNGSNIYENGNIIFNLVNECGLSGDEIVSEIQGLCMNRQKALVNLYHQGLRGEHLRKCLIKNFTKDHLNKLIYLMRDKYFSPEKAVQRMNTLYTFSGFIQNFVPACVRAQPEDVSEPLLSSTRSLGNH